MERLKESLHIAFNNLSTNAARSVLSILGVVIGIAAVITVLSIAAGARERILEQINAMGVNVYTVHARYDESTQRMGDLDLQDIDRLSALPFVQAALPQMNLYKTLRSRAFEGRGIILGVGTSYVDAKNLTMRYGRNFSVLEAEERTPVCLISESAAKAFFPNEGNPVGQTIFVEQIPWQVIGVYTRSFGAKKPARPGSPTELELLAPLNALMRSLKDLNIQSIEVHVKPEAGPAVKDDLLRAMERDDPKRKNLYMVRDTKDFYNRSLQVQNNLSMIGALVAGISLIVGGIGMMNVMLTSVAERTREIGVRRAVGARKKDILFQFLIESCVLSCAGGLLGLVLGAGLAHGLPLVFKDFFDVIPKMQPMFLVLAVGSGVVLGVTFGFYPAVKASKLSPAEALRSE